MGHFDKKIVDSINIKYHILIVKHLRYQLLFPNHEDDMVPKKFAAVCWTDLLSNLGDLSLLVSRMTGVVVEEVSKVLGLVLVGARGSNWNLEQVLVEPESRLWLSLGMFL